MSWVEELQRGANPNIVIVLVANKVDLLNYQCYKAVDLKVR